MSLFLNDRPVAFTQYPNGETVVPDISAIIESGIQREFIEVRLHWESDLDLIRLVLLRGMIRQALNDRDAEDLKPRLFIDYMPYSRMDRAQDGHCFSLLYVAGLINTLDFGKIFVVEPHSYTTQLLLRAEPVWTTAKLTPKAMRMMAFDKETDFLILPDAGAYKRYAEQVPEINECHVIVLKKDRDFATGKIRGLVIDHSIIRGEPPTTARKALILDDLSSRGGTFVGAAKMLRERGFREVSLLVTHMEPVGLTGDLPKELNRVFFSDTITVPRPLPSNFEIFQRSDWL